MSSLFNTELFHKSTTQELNVIQNRVRNLIGDSNWAKEGGYKEAILRNIIKRFLPQNFRIGTGFIIKPKKNNLRRTDIKCSTQVDIIIFDASYPLLFSEGDFYIVTPDCVRAIIEVKSNIQNQDLADIINKGNKLGGFISSSNSKQPIFNGIFSYEGYENINTKQDVERHIEDKIKSGVEGINYVNHISLNNKIFLKNFGHRIQEAGRDKYLFNIFSVYKIKDLSFSFFISNLLKLLVGSPIGERFELWFPIDKEEFKLKDISVMGI